jgi:hypothetical protein
MLAWRLVVATSNSYCELTENNTIKNSAHNVQTTKILFLILHISIFYTILSNSKLKGPPKKKTMYPRIRIREVM